MGLTLFIFKISCAQTAQFKQQEIANINNIIRLFKQKNIDSISTIVLFPLQREHPIPNVNNAAELKLRFDEVFDTDLVDKIANSKIEQWSEIGWRGIAFDNGIIWIDGQEGKITAVTYQSNVEKEKRKAIIDKDKASLHQSLTDFESPKHTITTKSYLIRIDNLPEYKYRYASWKIGRKKSSKPNMVLNNGVLEYDGNGGNYMITFLDKDYRYKIYRYVLGADNSPDITLEIEKNGKVVLKEEGKLVQ